jgi:hypothetical protein
MPFPRGPQSAWRGHERALKPSGMRRHREVPVRRHRRLPRGLATGWTSPCHPAGGQGDGGRTGSSARRTARMRPQPPTKTAAPYVKGRSLSVELSGRTERGQDARSPLHTFLHTGGHRVVRQPPPAAATGAHTATRGDLDDVRACPLRQESCSAPARTPPSWHTSAAPWQPCSARCQWA